MDSALGEPAQSLRHRMVVDPEQPGDPGNRDAPAAKLNSLQCHRLINRGHDRIPKLNNQRQSGRGSRPLRSRPPFPAGGQSGRRPTDFPTTDRLRGRAQGSAPKRRSERVQNSQQGESWTRKPSAATVWPVDPPSIVGHATVRQSGSSKPSAETKGIERGEHEEVDNDSTKYRRRHGRRRRYENARAERTVRAGIPRRKQHGAARGTAPERRGNRRPKVGRRRIVDNSRRRGACAGGRRRGPGRAGRDTASNSSHADRRTETPNARDDANDATTVAHQTAGSRLDGLRHHRSER